MDSELLQSFVRVGLKMDNEPRNLYTAGMEQRAMREKLQNKSQSTHSHDSDHVCRRKKSTKNPMHIEKKSKHPKKKHEIILNKGYVDTFTDRDRAVAASFRQEIELLKKVRPKKPIEGEPVEEPAADTVTVPETTDKSPKPVAVPETRIISYKDFLPAPSNITHLQRSQVKIEKRKKHFDHTMGSEGYTDMVRAAAVTFGTYDIKKDLYEKRKHDKKNYFKIPEMNNPEVIIEWASREINIQHLERGVLLLSKANTLIDLFLACTYETFGVLLQSLDT